MILLGWFAVKAFYSPVTNRSTAMLTDCPTRDIARSYNAKKYRKINIIANLGSE